MFGVVSRRSVRIEKIQRGVNQLQIRNGNWKRASLVPYVVAFPLMALAYLMLGLLGG
jgi:hypothetical protein